MTLITLQQIRDKSPCREGWKTLLNYLGNPDDMTIYISIGDIAKSNGAQDALWCTRCLPDSERKNVIRAILPAVKRASTYSKDESVSKCIETIEAWLDGKATVEDLRVAVAAADAAAVAAADAAAVARWAAVADAADAADAARWADAADAARWAAAAADAAADAAAAARWAAAADAAADERKRQVSDIIAIFPTTR